MNTLFWALQIILAIKLLTVTFNHGLRPDPVKMQRGRKRFGGLAQPLFVMIALFALLTATALVLPVAQGFLAWTALFTAVLMLAATAFHLGCRETPKVWVSLILFAMAAFLAYGRWNLYPL
jgi:hypothetical protein